MHFARVVAIFVAACAVCGCRSAVDPNAGRFSCTTAADCGDGYECRAQAAGGSLCFKNGECTPDEVCDGADQNCDGQIDETFPESGMACQSELLGACKAGTLRCLIGTLTCTSMTMPVTESCNAIDDDCDGQVDEGFDFQVDESNCGRCGVVCSTGTTCLSATCEETRCDDATDNDSDGKTDCQDESCANLACFTPTPPEWRCGVLSGPGPDGGLDGGDDAGFDDGGLDGGSDAGADAGFDGGLDAGLIRGCFAPESNCANGFDDDGDGLSDCADLDCDGRTCLSGTQCTARMCPGPG